MQLDLNLLTALDALLEDGSVTGAAKRLRLSAPAVSRTLTRIRRATGDAILVRAGRAMTPTPYAVAIRADVHRLVQEAQSVLSPQHAIDPATLDRTFSLRWHDALTELVGPDLLAAVRRQAPGVRLRFLPESSSDDDDLRRGQVHLETSGSEPTAPDVHHELVMNDRLVVVFRCGHPLATGRLTVKRYSSAAHVIVSRRGRLRDRLDEALQQQHGLLRDVVTTAPTGAVALQFVHRSDLVVTVPALVAGPAVEARGLTSRPLPVTMPAIGLYLTWHRRYDTDPAHVWLRGIARASLQDLRLA